ncbi:hypothetical protein YC2023_019386 [Brassica napus]
MHKVQRATMISLQPHLLKTEKDAFRVFDRNQTGYVRVRRSLNSSSLNNHLIISQNVEDMRITIHSLGKFISHREVKELVQSALLESNTGRDDRILYNKLVRELETI